MQKSPLAPLAMSPTKPVKGVRWAAYSAGLRYKDRDDLLLIEFSPETNIAGVATQSTTAGHPVLWNRRHLHCGSVRGILVNAGNANVFRGIEGDNAVELTANTVASLLECAPSEVFIASTGVIGERLPVEKLCEAIPLVAQELNENDLAEAASAIMTTDTFPKWSTVETQIAGQSVTIAGIAKGSGMIAPDMATMLAFVVTDAAISSAVLQKLVKDGADQSFNVITVDSDTSTSDTLLLCATGKAKNAIIEKADAEEAQQFRDALFELMRELALMIVRDGEGAQKLISIHVSGAASASSARKIGKAIANSPLVKTAIAGEDANWGRVIMAIGKSGEPIEAHKLAISFGGNLVALNGAAVQDRDERIVDNYLKEREIDIEVLVGSGVGKASVWTCDLTHAYIDINADYRS